MVDARVKKGAELFTDHLLVICILRDLNHPRTRKRFRARRAYRIKWELLADKKVRHTCANQVVSLFRELPDFTDDVETEWDLFTSAVITSAAASCGCKHVKGRTSSEKRTVWWNQEAIRAKKAVFRVCLTNKSFKQLRLRYSAESKISATIAKQSKKKSWKEFGKKLNTDYRSANKVFWQTIRPLRGKRTLVATFIEDANSLLLKHQKETLNCWREYFCELLNPVTVQHLETFEKHIGEEIYLTEVEVSTAIKSLKAGMVPGEDDIRPEMLKAMNNFGVHCMLIRVFQVVWKTNEVPKQWQTSVLILIHKKGDKKKCTNYSGISLLSLPEKIHAKYLKKICPKIVEPQLQNAKSGFLLGRSTMD